MSSSNKSHGNIQIRYHYGNLSLDNTVISLYEGEIKKYEGNIKNGLPHGNGAYYDRNGNKVYEGVWKNGLIELENGIGFDYTSEKLCGLYENGMKKYEGEMNNGIPDGKGVYYDKNGHKKYDGYWVDGEIHIEGSEWFCYESGKVERKRVRKAIENSKQIMKEVMKWMKTKTGKIVMGISFVMIVLILLIIERFNGYFFKMGSGYAIKDGVLTISGGNYVVGDFIISGYNNVKSIVVKKNSLMNLNSLTITNNPKLESLIAEDGTWVDSDDSYYAPFENVKDVTIASRVVFDLIITRSSSIYYIENRNWFIL